ncbi:helicase associated domain-containing protein [Embleya sp. NBC_00896]|uniref:helicase associated domain-containing protein n=1 Tax=Embleya sp. NBC_00896 TaxID=2975961 RepID=UPI002F91A36E|nr:helicase associated domain-containing protein [Embleya sp. NBC_00896]
MRRLVMLGMVWSHPDAAFEDGLAVARRWAQRHGHLAAPQSAFQDGVRVGQWLANQRRAGVLDAHPERRRALEELDPWWKPEGWSIAWQRAANEVRLFLARGGSLEELAPGHIAGGQDIGAWAQRQTRPTVWAKLRPGQIEQLDELGIPADGGAAADEGDAARVGGGDGVAVAIGAGEAMDGAVVAVGDGGAEGGGGNGVVEGGAPVGEGGGSRAPRRGRGAWETAFAAAVAYRQREGHLEVPRAHVETVTTENDADGRTRRPAGATAASRRGSGTDLAAAKGGETVEVRLGKWVNNQRTRRSSLSVERGRLLTELGMRW